MKLNRKRFEAWLNSFPPIEECTDMEGGNRSVNCINKPICDIDERVIKLTPGLAVED